MPRATRSRPTELQMILQHVKDGSSVLRIAVHFGPFISAVQARKAFDQHYWTSTGCRMLQPRKTWGYLTRFQHTRVCRGELRTQLVPHLADAGPQLPTPQKHATNTAQHVQSYLRGSSAMKMSPVIWLKAERCRMASWRRNSLHTRSGYLHPIA
jgi:hypothetical protein